MDTMTIELLQRAMPKQVKNRVTQELVDSINTTFTDPILLEEYRDNLLSYTSVMRDGRFKMHQYLDAVKYVGHKLQGDSNIDAWVKTFPKRYQKFMAQGTSSKDLASYTTSYNKNKLVNLIYEQTLTPTYIINADVLQKAINVQADLMINACSEKVRCDAANSLMGHLKAPEVTKIELDVGIKESVDLTELRELTSLFARQQREKIINGESSVKEIAESVIIEAATNG